MQTLKNKIKEKEEPKEEPFFVTTAIDYASGLPHVGHAYEKIAADIVTRYWARRGRETFYLTGTDEHGLKILQAANERKISPKLFVDEISLKYRASWSALEIRHDNFIRTTDPAHEKYVQEFVQKLYDLGEIYKDRYEGLYCVGCEEYKTKSELGKGEVCPIHQKKCQGVFEDIYFFKLSRFQKQLIDVIENDKIEIRPIERKNEILSFLKKEPLRDLAISRSKVSWGIPVPWDKEQTIYVWVDALLNYITGSRGHWPPSLQIIGKDIFRFHCVIWPAMLMAAGLELPRKIFIHGFLTVNGEKISKSRGNVIDPLQIARIYGVDALRYFLFREITFGQDGDFTIDRFEQRYRADLANDLGNLVQRVITMANRYKICWQCRIVTKSYYQIDRAIENLEFHKALNLIWDIIIEANKKVDSEKPWELAKTNPEELQRVIGQLLDAITQIAYQIDPFLPETSWLILDQLKCLKPNLLFPRQNK
ncbi:MAG: methionine--tRNA ligase [Patescibacteria group bacterium]